MPVYFVAHPNLEQRAKVTAPSTEKARTTFLDYLERSGLIYRRDRHTYRTNMVAERLEDPEAAYAPIELHYEYGEDEVGGKYRLGETKTPIQEEVEPRLYGKEEEVSPGELDSDWWSEAEKVEEPGRPSEGPELLSPIEKVALGLG